MEYKEMVVRFQNLYAGVVYDALKFDVKYDTQWPDFPRMCVLDRGIRPLTNYALPTVGRAFTCKGIRSGSLSKVADHKRIEMLKEFTPGCVFVLDTDENSDGVAHFGDISAKLARQAGAVGAVLDGYTRDAAQIKPMRSHFSLYCRGVQPQDAYGYWQIERWQCHIQIGKVRLQPEDIIFADFDGVIVIPQECCVQVLKLAEERAAHERHIRKRIDEGDDPEAIYKEENRW